MAIGRAIIWLLAGATFFLSLWIVLPAPTLFWLPLAVGAPEISPLLAAVSLILLGTAIAIKPRNRSSKFGQRSKRGLPRLNFSPATTLLIALLLASLGLSSLPLLQQPSAVAQAEKSMAMAFPSLKQTASSGSFSSPFSGLNFVRGMPVDEVRSQTHIPFASPAGTELTLDLYQPLLPGSYPAVVTIYGGSWAEGSPMSSEAIARFLATRGYVVVAIDYRHAPQYQFPAQLEDVQTALAFVRDRADEYEIDRDAIALLGWSAGAQLAMLAGFQPNANIRSIIDYYGPVDLAAGYSDPPNPDPIDVKKVLSAFMGGTPSEFPEAYAQASPITYVKSAISSPEADPLPPVLLIYGGRDHIVEARFGRKLYDLLKLSGSAAVFIKIPWAEHAFDKIFNGVSNQLALHFVEQFLDQTLRP